MNFVEGEILHINKPYGMSSFGALAFVRTRISRAAGVKRVKTGHAGTLDPLATAATCVIITKAQSRTHTLSHTHTHAHGCINARREGVAEQEHLVLALKRMRVFRVTMA